MSISSETHRADYTGNGAASTYSFNFKIFSDSELEVKTRTSGGVESTLTLTTDYTVSGAGEESGGSITLVAGNLTSGSHLSIRRVLPITQPTALRNQGEFFPETHEDQFDRTIMIAQQLEDEIERSVRLSSSIDPDDFDATLPADIASNPNYVIMVNDDGDGFSLASTTPSTDNTRVSKSGDTMSGDLSIGSTASVKYLAQNRAKFYDADSSNFTALRAPSTLASDRTITLPNYAFDFPTAGPVAGNYLKYDGSNYGWATRAGGVVAKAANYIVTDIDDYTFIAMTTAGTGKFVTLPTLADNQGRQITVKKVDSGAASCTVQGEGAETVDGIASFLLVDQDDYVTVQAGPSEWVIIAKGMGKRGLSRVRDEVGAGHGSTNTKVRRIETSVANTGNAITRAVSATNGNSYTINQNGVYAISYSDIATGAAATIGLSRNSAELTTGVASITSASRLAIIDTAAANLSGFCSATIYLAAGDVIRPHTDGTPNATSNAHIAFEIAKVGI